MSQSRSTHRNNLTSYVQDLSETARALYEALDPITFPQTTERLSQLAFRTCLLRQIEGLDGGVALSRVGLGHLSVMFVRPACDEYFWLSYLGSIDRTSRRSLLIQLAQLEAQTTVLAQQQFAGKNDMRQLSFPSAFVRKAERSRAAARARIIAQGRDLGWPQVEGSSATVIPSTKWVAGRAGKDKLYDFLYSASSQMLHFSMGEVARRGWAESETSELDLASSSYTDYRTSFGLYWTTHLLILTLATGRHLEVDFPAPAGEIVARYREAVERLACIGKVPIVRSAEFNVASGSATVADSLPRTTHRRES